MKNIEDFLESVGGRQSSKTKSDEWVLECWVCHKELLFFNINKMVGYCVYCDKTRTLQQIAREMAGIPTRQIEEFIEQHRADSLRIGSFKESILVGLLGQENPQADKQLVEMRWPEGYRSLEDGKSSVVGKQAAAYLTGRGFNLGELYELQFGYCATGFFAGRVIIPTFINGVLVYWQARDFTGRVPISEKILNPVTKAGNGKSEVLFNYDRAKTSTTIIVVESWGSCLATGVFATAVNGKHLSDTQLKLLLDTKAESFIFLFDAGVGTAGAWRSAENLSKFRTCYVATLPWGDPNEVPKSVRNKAIRDCQLYTKADYIKFKLESVGKKSSQSSTE